MLLKSPKIMISSVKMCCLKLLIGVISSPAFTYPDQQQNNQKLNRNTQANNLGAGASGTEKRWSREADGEDGTTLGAVLGAGISDRTQTGPQERAAAVWTLERVAVLRVLLQLL